MARPRFLTYRGNPHCRIVSMHGIATGVAGRHL